MVATKIADIAGLADRQRAAFATRKSQDLRFRIEGLRRLRQAIRKEEKRFTQALEQDLGKPALEAYGGDIAPLLAELDRLIFHTREWSRPRHVSTPLLIPAKSRVHPVPYGVVLVLAPWNYPLQLALVPAAGAIAAGNHVTIKPSELAPATASLIAEVIGRCFRPEHVTVVTGGTRQAQALLKQRWDYIFFTGGSKTGRAVMSAAAGHLTPVTLELGGKNPCVVTQSADIKAAAKRIAWGKFFNCGQTCVAPDYVVVHESVKDQLLSQLQQRIAKFYGPDPAISPSYGRIVNEAHLTRLAGLLEGADVVAGGTWVDEERYMAPTLVDGVSWDSPLMADEIFGPILPLLTYRNLPETLTKLDSLPSPLVAYLFSSNRKEQQRFVHTHAGAVVMNDTLLHFTNPHLPFGGLGESGMGAYHGRRTFDTFSHQKAVMRHRGWPRLIGVRWPPYKLPMWLVKKSLKWFG